jgi:hypothetical protein
MAQKIVIALLGAFTGAGATLFIEGTPEAQARRDVARCNEVARLMIAQRSAGRPVTAPTAPSIWDLSPPVHADQNELFGYAFLCLTGRK